MEMNFELFMFNKTEGRKNLLTSLKMQMKQFHDRNKQKITMRFNWLSKFKQMFFILTILKE